MGSERFSRRSGRLKFTSCPIWSQETTFPTVLKCWKSAGIPVSFPMLLLFGRLEKVILLAFVTMAIGKRIKRPTTVSSRRKYFDFANDILIRPSRQGTFVVTNIIYHDLYAKYNQFWRSAMVLKKGNRDVLAWIEYNNISLFECECTIYVCAFS